MNEIDNSVVESKLRDGLGTPPTADFEAWRSRHGGAVAYLNPVVTRIYHRRRRFFRRFASAALVAVLLVSAAIWMSVSQDRTFAEAINTINKAETMTYSIFFYNREFSRDGKRSWLRAEPRMERSFMAPNHWRDVRYAQDGTIAWVDIEDTMAGKVLQLDMKKKEAMLKNRPSGQFAASTVTPYKPLDNFAKMLEHEPIEFAGQRDVNGVKVNVFRYHTKFAQGGSASTEIWLDAASKRFMGFCDTPGDDYFDPGTDPDRNNPAEEKFSKGTCAGTISRDFVFGAQLDSALFSLTPPEGFKVVQPPPRPKITEELMIEWLRLAAQANNGEFIALENGVNNNWHNTIANKKGSDRNEAEQRYMKVTYQYMLDGVYPPIQEFIEEFTETRSFRYLGKGVKLGTGDRIVCFYKLKSTGKYRAVYGDLHVKDIDPKDLPLPVD